MKKFYRSTIDRKIAGVCGGLGEYFQLDPLIVRVLFLVLIFCGGITILAYLVMWIIVPERDEKGIKLEGKRLCLSDSNKKLAGVCAGLGEFFDRDPVLFRVGFIILGVMGGIGIVLYLIIWLLAPQCPKS